MSAVFRHGIGAEEAVPLAAQRAIVRLCAALAAFGACTLADSAAADPTEGARGFAPALSVGFDVQNQSVEVDVDNSLNVPAGESSTVLNALFRFDGALYSPPLREGGGAPRLFLHAGAQVPLSEMHAVLRENRELRELNPQVAQFCPVVTPPTGPESVRSCDQSASTDMRYDLSWYAGLGVEFTLPLGERRFRLRPSADYLAQSLDFEGEVARVDRGQFGVVVDEIRIQASGSTRVHALGPRLVLDVEALRAGALALHFFLEGQAFFVLSDRDVAFGGSSGAETAEFRVRLEPVIAQGGAGLRIVWRGE